jgi:hypothetical protein
MGSGIPSFIFREPFPLLDQISSHLLYKKEEFKNSANDAKRFEKD